MPSPHQMTIEECIAEAIAQPYVEPCPPCASKQCPFCQARSTDHSLDELVPCPCRAAGHLEETAAA